MQSAFCTNLYYKFKAIVAVEKKIKISDVVLFNDSIEKISVYWTDSMIPNS